MNLPNLSDERYMVVDVETHDPYLTTLGTNAIHRARGGVLLGFSVYVPGGFNEYFKYSPGCPAGQWLADQLARNGRVIGANFKYDLLWLLSEGLWTRQLAKRRYGDVLINAALLDENAPRTHNLNCQAPLYGLPPKKNDALLDAGRQLGLTTLKQVKENMHLIQEFYPEIMAEYGNYDTYVTGKVWEAQLPLLDAEGLTTPPKDRPYVMPVVELEERFLPILVLMEAGGIRVDIDHAKTLQEKLLIGIDEQKKIIVQHAKDEVNYNASGSLAAYIDKHYPDAERGKPHKTTGKTQPKMGESALVALSGYDPVLKACVEARKLSKLEGTFVNSYILKKHVDGRIYPNIWQLCGDDGDNDKSGGTSTGRQSYSKPNLQNIPIRSEIWGKLMRQMIIADHGCDLVSLDFSQQEPRWAITWAVIWGIAGAREAAQEFILNPDADWHGQVALMLGGLEYRAAGKVLVLARTYEQGEETCYKKMVEAGVPPENIPGAIATFDAKMPFLKAASKAASNYASKNGFVRTWSRRKRRFDLWEPAMDWDEFKQRKAAGLPKKYYQPLPREEALEEYFHSGPRRPIVRAKTYPAFNAVVQGSSADQTKQCTIVAFYKYDLVPDLEIHDEIVDGKVDNSDIIGMYKECMIDTIKLAVPNKVGITVGGYWQK